MKTDWAQVLNKAMAREADHVPPGWNTAEDVAESVGMARVTTARYLNHGLKNGVIEKKIFRVMTARGLYPVPHYREVKK